MAALPNQLTPGDFKSYPERARELASREVAALRKLPLSFLPLLLRELIVYDWKFPAEQKDLQAQVNYLASFRDDELAKVMEPFARLRLSPGIERLDWVNHPVQFSEQLSADLWATRQIDSFRGAATEFMRGFRAAVPQQLPPVPRLAIAVAGQGVDKSKTPLFRKLRPHGTYYGNVQKGRGLPVLVDAVGARARAHPEPFAHWHIDGGAAGVGGGGVTCVSYTALAPVRQALVDRMRVVARGATGPEAVTSALAQLRPEELGFDSEKDTAVLDRFQLSVLTEGSGTQFFSTTFVQWTAREALRRAQPLTVLSRFTPRQSEYSLDELLAGNGKAAVVDPAGALVDADMGAYYTWLNMRRLPGAAESRFLAWFEDHEEAVIIAPDFARGAASNDRIELEELVRRLV